MDVSVTLETVTRFLGRHTPKYLMADPELSLQRILIIATIIGRLKAWVYVGWVAVFSALAGLIYGAWIDGVSVWLLACSSRRPWSSTRK